MPKKPVEKFDVNFWQKYMPTYQMAVVMTLEKDIPSEYKKIAKKLEQVRENIKLMPSFKEADDLGTDIVARLHYSDAEGNQWWLATDSAIDSHSLCFKKLKMSYPEGELDSVPFTGLVLSTIPMELDLDYKPAKTLQDLIDENAIKPSSTMNM